MFLKKFFHPMGYFAPLRGIPRMPEEEAELYMALLKKTLSGTQGKNLIDVIFSTQQVMDSDEHRMLTALRTSELKDGEVRFRA